MPLIAKNFAKFFDHSADKEQALLQVIKVLQDGQPVLQQPYSGPAAVKAHKHLAAALPWARAAHVSNQVLRHRKRGLLGQVLALLNEYLQWFLPTSVPGSSTCHAAAVGSNCTDTRSGGQSSSSRKRPQHVDMLGASMPVHAAGMNHTLMYVHFVLAIADEAGKGGVAAILPQLLAPATGGRVYAGSSAVLVFAADMQHCALQTGPSPGIACTRHTSFQTLANAACM